MATVKLDPTTWIEDYGNYLLNFALSRVYDQVVAEDLVQETFLSGVKAKDSFQGKSSEKTWLTSILKRKIIDYYRKNSRNKEDKLLDNDNTFQKEGILKGHWEDGHLPNKWQMHGDSALETKEFYGVLKNCLSKLPQKMAATFTMKELEDYTTDEVCKELNITTSNLWVLMHRAKVQLRECIEKNWFLPDKREAR